MVLGLSVTPTTVGFVLVEGRGADGATLDREAFDVRAADGVTAVTVSEHVATAMLRAEAVAAVGDHRLASIGVTWSDEAEWEGSVLLESLIESGIDNVVAVGLPEATEALARGVGRVVDYQKTAVCVVEPGSVLALEVDTCGGGVQTVVNHAPESDAALVRWLTGILARDDWQPDGLVVVGSGGGIDALTERLHRQLPMPVIAPAEAELALARGAALASAHDDEWAELELPVTPPRVTQRRRMPLPYIGALTLLVAGALTFVVSVSLAVGLKLTSDSNARPADHRPIGTTPVPSALVQAVAPPAAPPIADVPAPAAVPPPAAEPPPDAAPIVDPPDAPPQQTPSDEQAPADVPPTDVPAAAPPPAPAPPPVQPTTPTVPPVQTDQGSWRDHSPLLTKILEHVPGLHRPPSDQAPASTGDLTPPPTDAPPPPPG